MFIYLNYTEKHQICKQVKINPLDTDNLQNIFNTLKFTRGRQEAMHVKMNVPVNKIIKNPGNALLKELIV